MKIIIILLSLISFVSFTVIAETNQQSPVQTLSPELRVLLKKEMNALQSAMNQIFIHFISGNTKEISDIAEQMKNSYILMQNLTELQKKELHHLPESFLEMDQKFHDLAGMLEHVAYNKNIDSIGFYYYKLVDTCMNCHAKHAQHRFPLLAKTKGKNSHGH